MTRPLLLAALLLCSGCDNAYTVEKEKIEVTQSEVRFFSCPVGASAKCECDWSKEAR